MFRSRLLLYDPQVESSKGDARAKVERPPHRTASRSGLRTTTRNVGRGSGNQSAGSGKHLKGVPRYIRDGNVALPTGEASYERVDCRHTDRCLRWIVAGADCKQRRGTSFCPREIA